MSFENGRTVEVVLEAAKGSDSQINLFRYDLNDNVPLGPNDPQALADRFRDDVRPHFGALYDGGWTILPVVVREVMDPLSPHAPRSGWESGTSFTGSKFNSSEALPQAICFCVNVLSDTIGRRYNGRLFVGGSWTEGEQTAGTFSQSAVDLVNSFIGAVPKQPDISPAGSTSRADWSIYSRTNRAAGNGHYLAHVKSTITRSKVHWLRSREQ